MKVKTIKFVELKNLFVNDYCSWQDPVMEITAWPSRTLPVNTVCRAIRMQV